MKEIRRESADVTVPRPNANSRWQCGYTNVGTPCISGPTADGECCQVVHAEAIREHCEAAGACELACTSASVCEIAKLRKDPVLPSARDLGPCVPQKSGWFSRQTIALNAAILVGGILLLCMAIPQKEQIFKPGGLSRKHNQILGNVLTSDRCSLCHPNSHPKHLTGVLQDDLCMKCHEAHLPDAVLRSPHDLTIDQLGAIAPNDSRKTKAQLVSARQDSSHAVPSTACAMCHIEHHGSGRDIKAITDTRCQSCHRSQFESFSVGHPQFAEYPYRTVRRIAFDHGAHQSKHFAQKNEAFACAKCHVDSTSSGSVGSVFRTVGFDEACASCHVEPIRASMVNGWAVLQLPCIAPEDSANRELGLADWPSEAQFGYEGEFSLPMRLLLAADPEAAAVMESIPASGKLAEVSRQQRPETTRTIARAFRRLVADVAVNGQTAWQKRLTEVGERALGRALNAHERGLVQEMSAGVPPDLFREIEGRWFRGAGSIAQRATQTDFQLVSGTLPVDAQSDELLADDLLDVPESEDPLGGEEDIDALLRNDAIGESDANALLGQDDLVGQDDLLGGAEPESADDLLLGGSDSSNFGGGTASSPPAKQKLTNLRGNEHVTQGGWYLDNELLSIRYMPRGHADATLSAWAEFAVLVLKNAGDAQTAAWHNPQLAMGQLLPGGCTECHIVGTEYQSQERWANWKSEVRSETIRLFTKFNHTPHLTLPIVNDCTYCHTLNASRGQTLTGEVEAALASVPRGVTRYVATEKAVNDFLHSEFDFMQRSQCVACHRPDGANDGCTQCHNYHVGTEGFEWSHSGM